MNLQNVNGSSSSEEMSPKPEATETIVQAFG